MHIIYLHKYTSLTISSSSPANMFHKVAPKESFLNNNLYLQTNLYRFQRVQTLIHKKIINQNDDAVPK